MLNFISLLWGRRSSETPFPIQKLPDLALIEVIRTVDLAEQIKLSLTSGKSARIVKKLGIKCSSFELHLGDKTFHLDVSYKKNNSEIETISVTEKEMRKISKRESYVPTVLEACPILLNATYPSNYSVVLYPGDLKMTSIQDLVESPLIQKCMNLKFKGGKLENEVLNAIMNMNVEEKSVEFDETDFPLDFHHENAFKFKKVKYSDTRWLRVEDICSIRSFQNIELGKSSFSSEDLNKLLHFWVNSEDDVLEGLEIKVDMDNLNREKMFDGLTTLEVMGRASLINPLFTFLHCEESETRRKPLLGMLFYKNRIFFKSYLVLPEINAQRMSEYQLLRRLERKRKLEEKNQNEDDYSIEKAREIEEIKNELLEQEVFFVDGMAKIQMTLMVATFFISEYYQKFYRRPL